MTLALKLAVVFVVAVAFPLGVAAALDSRARGKE